MLNNNVLQTNNFFLLRILYNNIEHLTINEKWFST